MTAPLAADSPAMAARRGRAVGVSAIVGVAVVLIARGQPVEYGYLAHGDLSLLARDAAALCAGGLAVGIVAPLVAGNHVPGLPLRALCVAWAAVALALQPVDTATTILTEGYARNVALAEPLLLGISAWLTTTACWLIDTRVTFPRLYPDPADRPPAKHTTIAEVVTVLLPHAAGIAVATGAMYAVVRDAQAWPARALPVAVVAILATASLQRLRPARSSLWTLVGVLAGVAAGAFIGAADTNSPLPDAQLAATPRQLLTCAVAGYAAILARRRPVVSRAD